MHHPPRGRCRSAAIGTGRNIFGEKLAYSGERNILVFGPNGSGKGTRFLIPNLLQMQDCSAFVIDPKGEVAATTARWRSTVSEVAILNPFGVLLDDPRFKDLESDGFNPFRPLRPEHLSFNAEASWLAEAMVTVEGHDPYWSKSARKLVSGLTMHVRDRYGPDASISEIRELLTAPITPAVAATDDKPGKPGTGIPSTAIEMTKSRHRSIRMKGGQFARWSREVASIVSVADTQTESFDDAEIAADLRKPGIDFADMKKRPMTVYVILPPDMMERHGKWLRLILSSALRAVMRRRLPGEKRVYFFMDEFAALGHLEIIETTRALVRGYGIQLVPVLQDLNQLKNLYEDRWETFIGMAGAVLAFGPNDLTTANWMRDRSGERTEIVLGYSTGNKPGELTGVSREQVERPVLTRKQLFDTPEGHGYLWLAGMNDHVPVYLPGHWEIDALKPIARDNPYFEPEE